jgi:hypothetical protein
MVSLNLFFFQSLGNIFSHMPSTATHPITTNPIPHILLSHAYRVEHVKKIKKFVSCFDLMIEIQKRFPFPSIHQLL